MSRIQFYRVNPAAPDPEGERLGEWTEADGLTDDADADLESLVYPQGRPEEMELIRPERRPPEPTAEDLLARFDGPYIYAISAPAEPRDPPESAQDDAESAREMQNPGPVPDNAVSINDSSEAPEGAAIVQGPRGGLYYIPAQGSAPAQDDADPRPDVPETGPPAPDVDFEPVDAERFNEAVQAMVDSDPAMSSFLTVHPPEDLENHRLFLTPDGLAGFAVSPEGDAQNLFRHPDGPKGVLKVALPLAIENGAITLDCYAGFLNVEYAKYGFRETARMKWVDEFAPETWDYDTFGRPDVVFMHLDPESEFEITEEYTDDWDKAKQDSRRKAVARPDARGDGTGLRGRERGTDSRTGTGGWRTLDGEEGEDPTAAIAVHTDPLAPPDGVELEPEEQALNRIFRGVAWDGDAETKMLAFSPSGMPEGVRDRLLDVLQDRGLFQHFETLDDSERWKIVDEFAQSVEGGEGWSVLDLAKSLRERTDLTEYESFRIARTEMAALTNRARELYYESREDLDDEALFRWTGPQDHRTTDACEWLKAQTKDGVTLDRLIELQKEASERFFPSLDFRRHVIHPFERHTYVRHYGGAT